MSFSTKTFTELVLICYLVVSSIAVVHAMPMPSSSGASDSAVLVSKGLPTQVVEIQVAPACHQSISALDQVMQSAPHAELGEQHTSASIACEVACAAMANFITPPLTLALAPLRNSTDPVFFGSEFHSYTSEIEQHPPK